MKICCDAGHGLSNKKTGIYDTGAVGYPGGVRTEEATITLEYAKTLKWTLEQRGHSVFMTRTSEKTPAKLETRASRAEANGCELFVSLHVNESDSGNPSGVEVWYHDALNAELARRAVNALAKATGRPNRGLKRGELAVLKFDGPCLLIELGFIRSAPDMTALAGRDNRLRICEALADALLNVEPHQTHP